MKRRISFVTSLFPEEVWEEKDGVKDKVKQKEKNNVKSKTKTNAHQAAQVQLSTPAQVADLDVDPNANNLPTLQTTHQRKDEHHPLKKMSAKPITLVTQPNNVDVMDADVFSVSQLNHKARMLLGEAIGHVWVKGEISNASKSASNHWYFTLKDNKAQLRCIMYQHAARALPFRIEDGLSVVVRGEVSVYEPSGSYQLQVILLQPEGQGSAHLARQQRYRALEAEGLFAPEKKRPLPFYPKTVGLVTSLQGAAVHDILKVLRWRFAAVNVLIASVQVQGEAASAQIAASIFEITREHEIDVLIVGRGGGASEDLSAFDSEEVVRAIAQSPVPIVSAVGHEVDVTLADLAADVRAPTPSSAAELVVPDQQLVLQEIAQQRQRLMEQMQNRLYVAMQQEKAHHGRLLATIEQMLQEKSAAWQSQERALGWVRPIKEIASLNNHLNQMESTLYHSLEKLVLKNKGLSNRLHQLLESLSPYQVLSRGYALLLNEQGKLLTSIKNVSQDASLQVRLKDGTVQVRVVQTSSNDPA